MSDIVERLTAERDRHVIGYPGPRRDVAELLGQAITALSEAEQRARREALEEAAKVTDARAKEYEDEARDLRGSEQDRRFCASVAFRLRATASAIRALIPSEPHDAEVKPSWQDPSIFGDAEGRN